MIASALTAIKRRLNDEARARGEPEGAWSRMLDVVRCLAAELPPEGGSELDFCRAALPVMPHEFESVLYYLVRKGLIWRRSDGPDRRIFASRPSSLPVCRGRIARSRPLDTMARDVHTAFSDGMLALVGAIDRKDEGVQRIAAESLRKAAGRLGAKGYTWATMRAALCVYRPDAIACLCRHETAFDERSGECRVAELPARARSSRGASLEDRLVRAIDVAPWSGVTVSDLMRSIRGTKATIAPILADLEARGCVRVHMAAYGHQGRRLVRRYLPADGVSALAA